jgi:mycothiol synthase
VLDRTGSIVGYAQANAEQPTIVESWGVVHPSHRGRGIGTALLDTIEERAAALLATVPSSRFRHAIDAGDHAAASMLAARGLRAVRHFWHMELEPSASAPGTGPPGGDVVIRTIDPATDVRAVHRVLDEAFAEDWDYHPSSFERWFEEHTSGDGYDLTLWLLATEGSEPVGAVTASRYEARGWIDEVGVRPGWRGRGIAAALLGRAFAAFALRGIPRVTLNVDATNPTGATRLYERAGMHIAARWQLWERSGDEPST